MNKMVYTIVKEQTLQDLVEAVQSALNVGYKLVGGFVYVTGYYCQTLIGEVEVTEDSDETSGTSD